MTIIGTEKLRSPKNESKALKEITLKDKLEETFPSRAKYLFNDESYIGGVLACPSNYFNIEKYENCYNGEEENCCEKCWNRRYSDEALIVDKSDLDAYIENII